MYVKHTHPVAYPVNNQIFQYDMAFYLENLEMNFIDTGVMKRSNENSVIEFFPSTTRQIEPLIYVPVYLLQAWVNSLRQNQVKNHQKIRSVHSIIKGNNVHYKRQFLVALLLSFASER